MAVRELPVVGGHPLGPAATNREDKWWIAPLLTVAVLGGFVVYATWAAFQGAHYYAGPYLSPFYSPLLFTDLSAPGHGPLAHAWLGSWPSWGPSFIPASPALLILPIPGLLRFTCYYYRKSYYRAFTGSPPGCAVNPASTRTYSGESRLLLFQNLHRYAFYLAMFYPPILLYDAYLACFYNGEFGIGVGTVIMFVNAILLGAYTFGCHSFRHLIGGGEDCMSCGNNTLQYKTWKNVSWLNARHALFAWVSLFWVAGTDIYIRLVSMGVLKDFNTWGP